MFSPAKYVSTEFCPTTFVQNNTSFVFVVFLYWGLNPGLMVGRGYMTEPHPIPCQQQQKTREKETKEKKSVWSLVLKGSPGIRKKPHTH